MPDIAIHLWFDREADEAARFYAGLFPGSRIDERSRIEDTPSGDVDILGFELAGLRFQAISAGPMFKFNPSFSLLVACDSREEVDRYRAALLEGGSELMPLGSYPFSGHYAWVVDRFGLSWQLMLADRHRGRSKIVPTLMYTGTASGKAEEAARFYSSLLDGRMGDVSRYGPGAEPDDPESANHLDFELGGTPFAAMDSAQPHGFAFNEAVSIIVACRSQEEIDRLWAALSAVPEAERCGWLKDRYGLSWQIVPAALGRLMAEADGEGRGRITRAFLAMGKFDVAALERAARGDPA